MVDWCPENTNPLLNAKCTKDISNKAFNYTYLLDVPVISSNSGVIYQNIFCGSCHREYYFFGYGYKLSCDCDQLNPSFIQTLNYQPANLTWVGDRPAESECLHPYEVKCVLEVDYPKNVGHTCEEHLIDTCSSESGGGIFWQTLIEGCENGDPYYVQNKHSMVYRNYNCSLCNGGNVLELLCLTPREIFAPSKKSVWDLSDLFSIDQAECHKNYIHDPIFGECDILEDLDIEDFSNDSSYIISPNRNDSLPIQTYNGPSAESIFFIVMMAVSIVCLFLHMVIYLITFKHRNLHSTNLFTLSIALFIAETCFVFGANFCSDYISCYVMTVIVYYFFLVAFLWMNVISFDICKTFHSQSLKYESNRTYLRYFFYAWGLPLLMTVCAIMIDLLAPESSVAPGFAKYGFWFSSAWGLLMFFIIPVEIIFVFNMVMLILSISAIAKQRKVGKFASASVKSSRKSSEKSSDSVSKASTLTRDEQHKVHRLITGKVKKTLEDHQSEVRKLKLYGTLAVLMGFPWIFAILVDVSIVFEYLFNIFNSLQGVFIFIAFDCRRKTIRNIKAVCSGDDFSSYNSSRNPYSSSSNSSSKSSSKKKRGKKKNRGDSSTSKGTTTSTVSDPPRDSETKEQSSEDEPIYEKYDDPWEEFEKEVSNAMRSDVLSSRISPPPPYQEHHPTHYGNGRPPYKEKYSKDQDCSNSDSSDDSDGAESNWSANRLNQVGGYDQVSHGNNSRRDNRSSYDYNMADRKYSLRKALSASSSDDDVVNL